MLSGASLATEAIFCRIWLPLFNGRKK